MARYSDLSKDVFSNVPNAPLPEIEHYARRAVYTFCRQSRSWVEGLEISLEAGVSSYRLRISNGQCDQVLRAAYITDKSRDSLPNQPHSKAITPSTNVNPGVPRAYSMHPSDGQRVFIHPVPGGQQFDIAVNPRAEFWVVAVPDRRSLSFPDYLADRYHEGLISGALSMLLGVTGKEWTDFDLAAFHARRFNQEITAARQATEADGGVVKRARLRRWV